MQANIMQSWTIEQENYNRKAFCRREPLNGLLPFQSCMHVCSKEQWYSCFNSHQHSQKKNTSRCRTQPHEASGTWSIQKKQISALSEEYWEFERVDKIYFNRSFDFSMDLFQIPYFSWMIYISDKLKEELERNCITGITFSIPGNKQYLVHRPNPILEWV